MPTECNPTLFDFARVEGRCVVASFDGGRITSDAGALLLGSTDRVVGLTRRLPRASPTRAMPPLSSTRSRRWSCNALSALRSATRT
jgi:hypothetical protein